MKLRAQRENTLDEQERALNYQLKQVRASKKSVLVPAPILGQTVANQSPQHKQNSFAKSKGHIQTQQYPVGERIAAAGNVGAVDRQLKKLELEENRQTFRDQGQA